MLGDAQIRGTNTASFIIWIKVGKLRAVRLQPTLPAACRLIICHFLIIPETHFPFEKFFCGNFSFVLYSPLGFLSNFPIFFLLFNKVVKAVKIYL